MTDRRARLAAAGADIVVVVTRDDARAQALARSLAVLGAIPIHVATCDQAAILIPRMLTRWAIVDLALEQVRELIVRLHQDTTQVVCVGGSSVDRVWALHNGCLEAIGSADPDEVALRLRALIARLPQGMHTLLQVGELCIDVHAGTMSWAGHPLPARRVLVRLAAALARRPGELVSTQTLLGEVWGEPWASPDRLHQAIKRLKRCLGPGARIVVSNRGVGYGLDARRVS